MEAILIFAGIITAVTAGVVQVIKKTTTIPNKLMPLISLVIGTAVGAATLFVPELNTNLSTGGQILGGLISGLAASGLYDVASKTTDGIKESV